MRSKQLLALMMAVAVTAQPQMVAASDSANQASEVQVQSSAEETETADQTVSEKATLVVGAKLALCCVSLNLWALTHHTDATGPSQSGLKWLRKHNYGQKTFKKQAIDTTHACSDPRIPQSSPPSWFSLSSRSLLRSL